MAGSMHSIQGIRYAMNGSGLKGIRCCDFGITRYSATFKVFWRTSEMPFSPLTPTLSPHGERGDSF
jgi:hypothetical protein